MPNAEQLQILEQGTPQWNRWRRENPDAEVDLSGANLRGLDLSLPDPALRDHPARRTYLSKLVRQRYPSGELGVDLHGARLMGAKLNEANLMRANLTDARLKKAKLTGANLREASFLGAEMTAATLVEADLRKASLAGAQLQEANLGQADLRGVTLVGADLSGADLSWADLRKADAHEAILTHANLSFANLTKASLWGAQLGGADLTQAQMVFTLLDGADLSGCAVFGVSAWGVSLGGATQSDLLVSRAGQPPVTVDRLEVAQFVYLLLESPKIRDVISTIGNRGVLILGRFTDDRKSIVDALRAALRERGYVPIVFDFEGAEERDLTETVLLLAGMSKFVIADLTKPRSVPHELAVLVPNYMIPFKPILQKGEPPYAMFGDYRKRFGNWVLKRLEYRDRAQLIGVLDKAIIAPLEKRHRELLLAKAREDVAEDADDFE